MHQPLCAINILRIALYVHHDDRYDVILPQFHISFPIPWCSFPTYLPREIVTNIVHTDITDV